MHESIMTIARAEASPPFVPAMPQKTIEGPAAWRGADIKDADDLAHLLTDAEIAELDAAVVGIVRGGIDHIAIDRHNFALPQLGKRLSQIRDEILLKGRGFMVIRGVPVGRYSIAEAAAAFLGIGAHFGRPVSQNGKGHILGHVKDLGRRIEDPNARIYQTTHKQTFHTDSADIVALLCLKTAKAGGLSRIVSSIFLYNEMFRRRPDLAAVLFEPLCFDRRGEVPAGRKGYYETPVFHWHADRLSVIYGNRYYIEFKPGDIQLLHNHVILHDRTDYEDWPEPGRKRHLLRLWLCPPNGRPLPAVFADRYGSTEIGNRGGIMLPGVQMVAPMEAC